MELIIGREAETSKLSIRFGQQETTLGQNGSVPKTVSRQHCRLSLTAEGTLSLSNISPKNITCVNGVQIESKTVTPNKDIVTLGSAGYLLDLVTIANYLKGLNPQKAKAPVKTVSISHLEQVWDTNHDIKLQIQIKEKKLGAARSITGIFSMSSVACGFIPGISEIPALRISLYVLAFMLVVYFFIVTYRSSSTLPKFMDELDRKFHDDYVCPNQECHHFLGYQPYYDLKKRDSCQFCKAKYTTDKK